GLALPRFAGGSLGLPGRRGAAADPRRGGQPASGAARRAGGPDDRPASGVTSMSVLLQDFRYALRGLARTPGFTAAALSTLAIAFGANAPMFSLVHAVPLRRIPVEAPDRLVRLGQPKGALHANASPANLADWRARSRTLAGMSGWQIAGANLKAAADAERV